LQTLLQFHSRLHRPSGMFRTGFRNAKQHQKAIGTKELRSAMILLRQGSGHGKKNLA
jgi:hypothetical protein